MFSPEAYDRIVCAELPNIDTDPYLHSLVAQHMMHGPCGLLNPECPCMRKDIGCKNRYPKDFVKETRHAANSYPLYRRRNDKRVVKVRGFYLDNRWVIPYNAYLLSRFNCHMNVEICSTIQAVKYIYKYIYKGHDKILYQLTSIQADQIIDEIRNFQSARWISPPEAIWRIFGFDLNEIHPSVITLPVHLPNQQSISFAEQQSIQNIAHNTGLQRTMLTEFFSMNKYNPLAKYLQCLYTDFPQYFVWQQQGRLWEVRQQRQVIGRISTAHPTQGERYYLRMLLMHVRGPTSFEHLRTVNGCITKSFREATELLGLLYNDNNAEHCLNEAIVFQMPYSLRHLFATILLYCSPKNPIQLWDKYESFLSEDFHQNNSVPSHMIRLKVLQIINTYLEPMGKNLKDFGFGHIQFDEFPNEKEKKEIQAERNITVSEEDLYCITQLNHDQKSAYDRILNCIDQKIGKAFFIDGPGGTGKTFLYKALLATIRSRGQIALATATSGVAASILPGGRTAHSRFKIPIQDEQSKSCNISKQSVLAELNRDAQIIIWDEATMSKRSSVEALDRLLQDVMSNSNLFGNKVIVFGGDFRQTLPVIARGDKQDIIQASIVMSPIWKQFEKLQLKENMRARLDPEFSTFLLKVGDGTKPFIYDNYIRIPSSIHIPFIDDDSSVNTLINVVFGNLQDLRYSTASIMNKAILTTRNDFVHDINHRLIKKFPGNEYIYFSFDESLDPSANISYQDLYHSLTPKGLPLHELILKKNCPVMLLRNINPSEGLSNGTRLICKEFANNVIQAEIAFGSFIGKSVFIPRIPLEASDDEFSSIAFKRTQFPLRLSFAMTINKAQGQTLDFIGLYLKEPVFSHGQLYVALSRAKTAGNIKVLIRPVTALFENTNLTKNIVYKEILSQVQNSECC